jgi:hypothetical protein
LKLFIQNEADRIKSVLEQKLNRLSDKTLKIKLTEVISLLDTYKSIKSVDENHISALMRYYDLVNDL